jgi:hypothetical protein
MSRHNVKKPTHGGSSKNVSKASARAPEASADDLVLDFLYYDAPRIGSYLAQVDDSGHLQQVTQADTAARDVRRGSGIKASLNVPAIPGVTTEPVEASLGYDRSPGSSGSDTNQRVYDPQWTNARTFLDFFEAEGLIKHDLGKARMGQFVSVDCDLFVMDVDSVQPLLQSPMIQQFIAGSVNPNDPNQQLGLQLALLIVPTMHLGIQVRMLSGGKHIWGTLLPQFMSIQTGDLLLKHGIRLAGRWTAVGILDAFPDTTIPALPSQFQGFAAAAEGLGAMRKILGRPPEAFGMTPLLIFRQVSGA